MAFKNGKKKRKHESSSEEDSSDDTSASGSDRGEDSEEEWVDFDDGEGEEDAQDGTPPPTQQKKKSQGTADFNTSLAEAGLYLSSSSKQENADKLAGLLRQVRKAADGGAATTRATQETLRNLKKEGKAKSAGSKKSGKGKKNTRSPVSPKKKGKGRERNTFCVASVSLLPYGVKMARQKRELPGQSMYRLSNDVNKISSSFLMELENNGLSVRKPTGIHLPLSEDHKELKAALTALLPEPFQYIADNLASETSAGWLVCVKEPGRHQKWGVSSKAFPNGGDLDWCTQTNRTGFRQRNVILTTTKAIPTKVLDNWEKAKRLEGAPTGTSEKERPSKKKRTSSISATAETAESALEEDDKPEPIPPNGMSITQFAEVYMADVELPEEDRISSASGNTRNPDLERGSDASGSDDSGSERGSDDGSDGMVSRRSHRASGRGRSPIIISDDEGEGNGEDRNVAGPSTLRRASFTLDKSLGNPWASERSWAF